MFSGIENNFAPATGAGGPLQDLNGRKGRPKQGDDQRLGKLPLPVRSLPQTPIIVAFP